MTPTALRKLLVAFLDGDKSLSELAIELCALGQSPSAKVAARIESLLEEIRGLQDTKTTHSRWPRSAFIVRGLVGELLDSLPEHNVPPEIKSILTTLEKLKPQIDKAYGVALVGLGGSSISASRTAFSDIDIAVKTTRKVTLFDMAHANESIAQALNWPVDLVFLDFAEPPFRERFLQNLVSLEATSV